MSGCDDKNCNKCTKFQVEELKLKDIAVIVLKFAFSNAHTEEQKVNFITEVLETMYYNGKDSKNSSTH